MDIDTLREFTSLFETLSFQETADRLCVSQSALTKHIHKLEEELGVSLFDRSTRSVRPNAFSETFYPYAEQIVRTQEEGQKAVKDLEKSSETRLRLAFTSTCSNYGIVETISTFAKLYSQFHTHITESILACEMLKNRQCDFAFANDAIAIDENLSRVIYKVDRLALFLPSSDPLAQQKSVSIEMLRDRPLIAHSRANGAYHADTLRALAACRRAQVTPEITSNASFTSTIMKLILEGQGASALFRGQIPDDQLDPRITPVDIEPAIESVVYLLYDKEGRHTPARKAFLQYLINLSHMDE